MNGRLGQARALGGVGSILVLLSIGLAFLAPAAVVLAITGLVLILVALKYISDETGEPKIFSYALYSTVAGIVGLALASAFLITFLIAVLRPMSEAWVAGLAFLAALILTWAAMLVSAVFLRRSFALAAEKTGVGLFSTAGLLFLVGAALTVVLVGLIIVLVAYIVMAVAFFSLPEAVPKPPEGSAPRDR